jgi:hypothetical protein
VGGALGNKRRHPFFYGSVPGNAPSEGTSSTITLNNTYLDLETITMTSGKSIPQADSVDMDFNSQSTEKESNIHLTDSVPY